MRQNVEDKIEKEVKIKKEIFFFKNYGKKIKLGVIENIQNINKLAKSLRFYFFYNLDLLANFDESIKEWRL